YAQPRPPAPPSFPTRRSSDLSLSIVFALAFPIGYGLWDLRQSGKINPFSVLGVVSVFLTGGISLLELDPQYIAIKEAAIPAIIGDRKSTRLNSQSRENLVCRL